MYKINPTAQSSHILKTRNMYMQTTLIYYTQDFAVRFVQWLITKHASTLIAAMQQGTYDVYIKQGKKLQGFDISWTAKGSSQI